MPADKFKIIQVSSANEADIRGAFMQAMEQVRILVMEHNGVRTTTTYRGTAAGASKFDQSAIQELNSNFSNLMMSQVTVGRSGLPAQSLKFLGF